MNTRKISQSLLLFFCLNGYALSFSVYEQNRYRMYELGKSMNGIDNSLRNIDRRMQQEKERREMDYMMNSILKPNTVKPLDIEPINYQQMYKGTALDPNSGYEPEFLKTRRLNEKNVKEAGDAFFNHFFK